MALLSIMQVHAIVCVDICVLPCCTALFCRAPEVCTNQPYTFKSDLWSLGCVLYELCALT
jgi:hypothetical protein